MIALDVIAIGVYRVRRAYHAQAPFSKNDPQEASLSESFLRPTSLLLFVSAKVEQAIGCQPRIACIIENAYDRTAEIGPLV